MRRLLALLALLLCLPGLAGAAIVRVQSANTQAWPVDSQGTSFGTNIGSGHLLIAWCLSWSGEGFSSANPVMSDTLGHTWTVVLNRGLDDPNLNRHHVYLAYALTTTSGADTVTCNPPDVTAEISLTVAEYSGMAPAALLDQTASNSDPAGSTAVSTGTTGTTVQANELLIAGMVGEAADTTITETAPLVLVSESEPAMLNAAGDRILSATGTYSGAWTLGAARLWVAGVATFKGLPTRPRAWVVLP